MSDETYSRGERIFLLFAGGFGFLTCTAFIALLVWAGFFATRPYARHVPPYRVFLLSALLALLATKAVKLAIEAYHGKVLD